MDTNNTPPIDTLAGSHLKLKRANYHINDLEAQSRIFFGDGDTYRFFAKVDLGIQNNIVYFCLDKTMPEMWAAIVGDACFNLISALDHLYIALRQRKDGGSTGQFPINKDFSAFNNLINNGEETKIGADAVDILVRTVQPYRVVNPDDGGNQALWLIKQLRNHDGHNFLIPTFSGAGGGFSGVIGGNRLFFGAVPFGTRFDDGIALGDANVLGVSVLPDGRVDPKPNITYAGDIQFGDIHGLDSQNVVPALQALSKEVHAVIDKFSVLF